MKDEEIAEEYAIENWKHYKEGQTDYKALKQAHLAGLKAGRPKWHKVTDGDLPKEKKEYWCKVFYYESEETFNAFLWFDPNTKEFKFLENIGEDEVSGFKVKEWREIPEE